MGENELNTVFYEALELLTRDEIKKQKKRVLMEQNMNLRGVIEHWVNINDERF